MSLPIRILLHLLGVGVGVIVWGMFGLGLVELGVLTTFDPIGVGRHPTADPNDAAGSSLLTSLAHWSGVVIVGFFAWRTPDLIGWLTKPPQTPDPTL